MSTPYNEDDRRRDPNGRWATTPRANSAATIALAEPSQWATLEYLQGLDEEALNRESVRSWPNEDDPSQYTYVMASGATVTVDRDDAEWREVSFENGSEVFELHKRWDETGRDYMDHDESISAIMEGGVVAIDFMTEGGCIETSRDRLSYTTPLDKHMNNVTYTKEGAHWLVNDGNTEAKIDEAEVNTVFAANHNTDFTVEEMADEYTKRVSV